MKTNLNILLKIILCMAFMTSCSDTQFSFQAEEMFTQQYGACTMNKLIKLTYIGKLFEGEKETNFNLEPTTDKSIMFPTGFNLKLLSYDTENTEWVEIKNNVQYFPEDAKYILGINDPVKERNLIFFGIIPNLGKKETLRAVVYGNVYQNGVETDQCTGAFIDFEFTP